MSTLRFTTLRWIFVAAFASFAVWLIHVAAYYYNHSCGSECVSPGEWWLHMSGVEAAAWVQAIGTVVAVLGAVAVSKHQSQRERILREQESKLQNSITRKVLINYLQTLSGTFSSLAEGNVPTDKQVTYASIRALFGFSAIEALESFSVRIANLPEKQFAALTLLIFSLTNYKSSVELAVIRSGDQYVLPLNETTKALAGPLASDIAKEIESTVALLCGKK